MMNKELFTQSELQELECLEIKGGNGKTEEATHYHYVWESCP